MKRGVVTSLDANGGVIDRRVSFTRRDTRGDLDVGDRVVYGIERGYFAVERWEDVRRIEEATRRHTYECTKLAAVLRSKSSSEYTDRD